MYTLTRKLSVVCLTVVLSFLVYGCGGSSKQALITDVSLDMVTGDLMPEPGIYTIEPGGTANAGDVSFTCPEGGPSCEVTVADDGTIVMSTSAEGMATAMVSASAAARLAAEERARLAGIAKDEALEAARLAGIAKDEALEAARLAGIAKDEALASAILSDEAKDEAVEAARLAGIAKDEALAAVMRAEKERDAALEELRLANLRLDPNDVDLGDLLENFTTITPGTYNIDAGGDPLDVDDATFTCPAGGLACEIVVADDGTVTSAGGMATAQNSMAANTSKMAIALTKAEGGALLSNVQERPRTQLMVAVERAPNGVTTIKLTPDSENDDGTYTSGTVDAGYGIAGWTGLTLKRNNAIAETETDRAEPATSIQEATLYTNIESARSGKLKYKQVPAPD